MDNLKLFKCSKCGEIVGYMPEDVFKTCSKNKFLDTFKCTRCKRDETEILVDKHCSTCQFVVSYNIYAERNIQTDKYVLNCKKCRNYSNWQELTQYGTS